MYNLNEFQQREALDQSLAEHVANCLSDAVSKTGKASIAVSGGSTPKGFFTALSKKELPWKDITITLADERWVNFDSDASNTRLVHENLLQNNATNAKFFHLKQGENLNSETLNDLDVAAKSTILPFDVLILGMGEDGHTASLFPCSEQISQALDVNNSNAVMKVVPATAPHDRVTFTYAHLVKSHQIILHISGSSKKNVLQQAITGEDAFKMPIRAFLHNPNVTTNVYWAE